MRIKILLLLSFVGLGYLGVHGQISSPSANYTTATQYSASSHQDSIYVFHNPGIARLKATHSSKGTCNMTWYKLNMVTKHFDQVDKSLAAVSSDLAITENGCYSVRVEPTMIGDAETDTAWVYLDNFDIIDVTIIENSCSKLRMQLNYDVNNLQYYALYSDISEPGFSTKPIQNKLEVTWRKNGETAVLDYGRIISLAGSSLPVEDAYYTVEVKDILNKVVTDQTLTIPAIAPLAKFDVAIWNGTNWSTAGTKVEGSAPMKIQMTSQSKNCDNITWTGFNDPYLFGAGGDSLLWDVTSSAISSPYESNELLPGKYKIRLIAEKISSGCRDTVELKYANVLYSKIDPSLIPNVFTPGGTFPYFKFKTDDTTLVRSIRDFHITIFNRWGGQVYSYNGTIGEWQGWDGKTDGADAAAGVYYFIINARGWDNVSYSSGPYKGFFYLFRSN